MPLRRIVYKPLPEPMLTRFTDPYMRHQGEVRFNDWSLITCRYTREASGYRSKFTLHLVWSRIGICVYLWENIAHQVQAMYIWGPNLVSSVHAPNASSVVAFSYYQDSHYNSKRVWLLDNEWLYMCAVSSQSLKLRSAMHRKPTLVLADIMIFVSRIVSRESVKSQCIRCRS